MRNENESNKNRITTRKLWIGIGILVLLSPLGLIIPKFFDAEGAWGEWGPDEIEKIAGFVPEGMKRLTERWKAPLPDYAVPGQGAGTVREGFGYLLAGIIGIAATAGVVHLLTKLLTRRNGSSENKE
jgi:hypothetical protein